jgi:hypothetical protein
MRARRLIRFAVVGLAFFAALPCGRGVDAASAAAQRPR